MSITPNYPCLITSAEPDRSWEGFSATEKISWLGVGGGVLDGEQSRRAVVDGRIGGTVGLLLTLTPPTPPTPLPQNEPGTIGQLPKPLPDNNMGRNETPFKQKRGEEEESHSVATTVGML